MSYVGRPVEVIPDELAGCWWILRRGQHVGTVWPGQLAGFWAHAYDSGRASKTTSHLTGP